MSLVYIDDCLLVSPSDDIIDQAIRDLQQADSRFNMEDQGTANDFLGIKVSQHKQPDATATD